MRRAVVVVVVFAAALSAAWPAAAAEECASPPADPTGYQVGAIHADQIQDPPLTPAIAVLDTGVTETPELAGRVRQGFDVTSETSNTADTDGHGTAVAGVAAASGAIRGVSPTSPILPIRIFDPRGESTAQWFVDGVDRALALGAGVINVSAEGPASQATLAVRRAVQDSIDRAVSAGVPVVAPSGNEGADHLDVPAAYPHVIAVGATDESNEVAPFSNRGFGLDLVAPGMNLYTIAPRAVCPSGFAFLSGTSFSAPAVAATAALLLQEHPGLDPTQLTQMLQTHGAPSFAWTPTLGFGLLDVAAVLAAPVPPPDAPEVDDTIQWAKRHRPVLTPRRKTAQFTAHVAPHSDPADTFWMHLKKGDDLRVAIRGVTGGVALAVSNGAVALRPGYIRRTGDYYVTVAATKKTPPAGTYYTLKLSR